MDDLERAQELEREIAALPVGYISRKKINGKVQCYYQWRENGKLKGRYLKEGELEPLEALILHRRNLQKELRKLKGASAFVKAPTVEFESNVITGDALFEFAKGVRGWEKRDCFSDMERYLYGESRDRVCLVFGLRRTGKTTMLRQAILDMSAENMRRCAYIKARNSDRMETLNRDLKQLFALGYRFVFLDEVTLLKDFIDSAALFSDVFAAQGMKLVLSGTDSLGFWFATHQELYDRAVTIHTTFIPFREHSRLLGLHDIDEYIRYGGTLRAGEIDFDDKELNAEEASFRDDESTRRYIDSAICRNIQHSLAYYEGGTHFRHLRSLYVAGELTGAINRIIESMSHAFLLDVLTNDFKSHDLGSAADVLRKERDPNKRTDILDRIDKETVTARLMEILEIQNQEMRTVGVTETHVAEIREYLKALDLFVDCPVETTIPGAEPLEHVLFTQPGMRYCQAQALVHVLMKDSTFASVSEREKQIVCDRILEEVRGRMMEDIVLLETQKAAQRYQRVFKLQFSRGEYDMVVYDERENRCAVYEIKHSGRDIPEQRRHLCDEEMLRQTERRFGSVVGRYVLYRGPTLSAPEDGVRYLNVEEYLETLSQEIIFADEQIRPSEIQTGEPPFDMTMM